MTWFLGFLLSTGSYLLYETFSCLCSSSRLLPFQPVKACNWTYFKSVNLRKLLVVSQRHGILNTVSWGILFPIGVIIARYLRTLPSADPVWFYVHVFCQFSAYVIGVAGWGTGLKLGVESPGIIYRAHRNIGIALFCFATLQVKISFFTVYKL